MIQDLASASQLDAVRQPIEKLALQLVFQLEDLPVDSGRRDIQGIGGLPHRLFPHRFGEIAKCDNVDVHETEHRFPW